MRPQILAAALTLAVAGSADAQSLSSGHLAAIDANGDGTVDKAEFDAFVAAAFDRLDVNHDGHITFQEGTAVISPEQFKAVNTNGDDGISREEFTSQVLKDFAAADKDGNGVLN